MIYSFLFAFVIAAIVSYLFVHFFLLNKIRKLSTYIKSQRIVQKEEIQQPSALKELEQQINKWSDERKEEIERLKNLENYRKEYLGNVSHELKTPIFNIQGYIATLLDGGLEDETINRTYLERAMKSVDRMVLILENLQAITQLEKGELEMEEERFDILHLITDIIDAQEMKASEKKIKLLLNNDTTLPIYVLADKFRIRQALVNLVVNSVRYGKENGKTTLKVADTGEKIIVEVADTGIGISEKHLSRIFERFYRTDKARSREEGGTGLGLSIVKHILEAHNQTINVISTEGAGSVFSFTLKKG